ncbi:MAG TPA: polymer-forming cytoskeletal protein [Candidatus Krumholzibacteria bacterium]|nr:polymer-forming cytoskeletal protein [Candidatus Krumholzibacteria bacterium]
MSPKEEATPQVAVATVLSAGTRAVGELHSSDDLVLVGSFEGRLRVDRALRIMPEGRLQGEVQAERILVLGQTQGSLHAQQRIEIKPGAVVSGEVVAPQIRIHEGVILNAKVHMSGPVGPPRHYLLPALLKSYAEGPREDLEETEQAAENFLRGMGFDLETRAERADRSGALRPIFRCREPLPYPKLRERLQRVEQALRAASAPAAAGATPEAPLQVTGTGGAREVAQALARLRRAALVVGPVALVRLDENPGDLHLSVRVRRTLPESAGVDGPDPATLLLSLQKLQHELLDELG